MFAVSRTALAKYKQFGTIKIFKHEEHPFAKKIEE